MEYFILEISRYLIAVCMAFYAFECFSAFRYRDPGRQNMLYIRQNVWMFSIHFLGFMAIILEQRDIRYLFFYAVQVITLFAVLVLLPAIYPNSSRLLTNNMCMLLMIGLVIQTRLSFTKSVRQFVIIAAALVLVLIIPVLIRKFTAWKSFTWLYALLGILFLTAVLVIGSVTNGSKLSFRMFGFAFQPSEFVKIVFVFCVAALLSQAKNFVTLAISAGVAGAHVLILVFSKDLGSALIFFIVYIGMLFCHTKQFRYLVLGAAAGAAASVFSYRLFGHVRVRVRAWKDPWSDLDATGYQITQSLFALGTGGWFGLGIYQGTPASIPYVETDFVFSAIGEEFGILFALCLILVYISCFLAFMNIAMQLKDKGYRLLAAGFGITLAFQVFLTVGGGIKLIPLTGVTLPLISYGGSSMLATIIIFGIMQGLHIICRKEQRAIAGDEAWEEDEEYFENEEYFEDKEELENGEYDEENEAETEFKP